MRPSRSGLMLAFAFVLVQVGASAGCNAILDNGYGVDDTAVSSPDGSGGEDALGGGDGDGGSRADGMMTTGDGSLDANGPDGAGCPNNVCPTMLASVVGPQRLAISANGLPGVYWAALAGIGRIDPDGSNMKKFAISQPIGANLKRGIAVNPDGTAAYVTMPGGTKSAARCAADLSSCNTVFLGTVGDASSIAVDASLVYVGIFDNGTGTGFGGAWQTALDGSNPQSYTMLTLATDMILDLQIVGATTYFRSPTQIRATTRTTMPATVATLGADPPLAFVVAGTKVFTATKSSLQSCTLPLPCAAGVILVRSTAPSAITADATRVYWVEKTAGTVHRCDMANCSSTYVLLAEGQASPNDIVVDGASVYWANYGNASGVGGAIMKLPK